jgi:hypothetical protein
MRALGINYDTGFLPGLASRPAFEPEAVRHDLAVIRRELHCAAVRISGGDPERLRIAAECAADEGLEIWLCPFPVDLGPAAMLELFVECADKAEVIRRGGAEVVLVTGCEVSAFGAGFIPGDDYQQRLRAMGSADLDWWMSLGPVLQRVNDFLAEAAGAVRKRFGGRISYASGPWESIDWEPFDLVGVDAYRAAYNAANFRAELREHVTHGKPVAVTEYGTCPYRGAGERGGLAWQVPDGAVADEGEQMRYFTELLEIFQQEGVDTALWFTFAGFNRRDEADLGSYGVVRVLDDTHWEPKEIFHAMAKHYAKES